MINLVFGATVDTFVLKDAIDNISKFFIKNHKYGVIVRSIELVNNYGQLKSPSKFFIN